MNGKTRCQEQIAVKPSQQREIKVDLDWVEATIFGNLYCPACGELMIIIPVWYVAMAFCPKCRKYWIQDTGINLEV